MLAIPAKPKWPLWLGRFKMASLRTIELIKKNRIYFAAKNSCGYDCKVKITSESENLELGSHDLLIEDVSVHSKYGVDLIYIVKSNVKETGIVSLKHFTYNAWLVDDCKKIGGKWDHEVKAWIFSAIVEDKVEELELEYNEKIVDVEITSKSDLVNCCNGVDFCGYTVALAKDRNGGVKLADGVYKISGEMKSGGSTKYWETRVSEGSVFRLKSSAALISRYHRWTVKVISA